MTLRRPSTLRARLTLWYVAVLAAMLVVYAIIVFTFQYAVLTRQLAHDEAQDVVTVEGLLYFDATGSLQLHQDYYSRPQSHLLVDRLMEVRDLDGNVLYRSPTLHGLPLGGPNHPGEGDRGFDERIVTLADGTHVFVVSHLHGMQNRLLLIRLGYSLAPLRARMLQFLILLAFAIPLALALAALAGQAIARRALRPIETITNRAEEISASNLSLRLEVQNPNDELGQMAKVFNHLLDRLEQAFQQLERFTADAAHELRTPLASLRTIGEVALTSASGDEVYRDALEGILEESSRLTETIDNLLLLARAEAMAPGTATTPVNAVELVRELIALLGVVIEEKHVTVLIEGEAQVTGIVAGNRGLLRIALINVLHNALKFTPERSMLRLTFAEVHEDRPLLRITLHDEGPGIKSGEQERVFDRFFTSSPPSNPGQTGTGLGLAIARLVVRRTGGQIWFDTDVTTGAKCVVDLPIGS